VKGTQRERERERERQKERQKERKRERRGRETITTTFCIRIRRPKQMEVSEKWLT
jgi:hypothetical protein